MQQRTEQAENTTPSQDAAPDSAKDVDGAVPGDAEAAASEAVPESAPSTAPSSMDQARPAANAATEPSDAATPAESSSDASGKPAEPLTVRPTPRPKAAESTATGPQATGPEASQPPTTQPPTGTEATGPAPADAPAATSPDTETTTHGTAAGAEQATLPAAGPAAAEPGPAAVEDATAPAAPVEPAADVELDPAPTRPTPAPVPARTAMSPSELGSVGRGGSDRYRDLPVHERIVPVQARTAAKPGAGRVARWGRRVLVVALTLALMGLIPALLARLYLIPSGSMEKTLHGCKGCDNDRVLVDRLVYRFSEPQPGEIVVFNAGPDIWKNSEVQNPGTTNPIVRSLELIGAHVGISPPAGSDFVKRVIAVSGQTVMCCDRRNRITIDGKPIDEPYLYFDPGAGAAVQKAFPKVTVPQGEIFVMGDNRNGSLDSRAPGNGPVPVSALAGKARFIVTPFDRFRKLDDINPQKPSQ